MPTMSELGARHVAAFLACVIFVQLVFYFREPLQSTFLHPISPFSNSEQGRQLHQQDPFGDTHEYSKTHHPTVALSLSELAILDDLTASIVKVEAKRTFANSGYSDIHGTSIKNDAEGAKRIRDQIDCWTRHGAWVREDEAPPVRKSKGKNATAKDTLPWAARKHLGDQLFAKCDARFSKGVNRVSQEGLGEFYVGEYDHTNGHGWIVREAVKYKWVPDESICGPPTTVTEEEGSGTTTTPTSTSTTTTTMGLKDARSRYQPYNKAQFCEALAQRNLLLAGDVTQFQLHDSILSAVSDPAPFSCHGDLLCLHFDPHELCPPTIITDTKTGIVTTTANASVLKYARNDVISVPWAVNPEDEDYPEASTVEQAWATDAMLSNYSILLLNKGLHWRPDDEFLMELVFTMKKLWKYYPETMILYRATHPVANCTVLKNQQEDEVLAKMVEVKKDAGKQEKEEEDDDDDDDKEEGDEVNSGTDTFDTQLISIVPGATLQRPLASPPKRRRERDQHNSVRNGGRVFRPTLADIQRQNRMAKVIVEAAGGIFWDTEDMFALRPDGRMGEGDCSRFCAPGPIDAYVDLLYNTLRILK